MSGDHTQHVLDAIDGALDDWSVSTDAMRWSPEPVAESSGPILTLPAHIQPRHERESDYLHAMQYTLTALALYRWPDRALDIITTVP